MKYNQRHCHVCGEKIAESSEHFIPQAVGNKGPVKLWFLDPKTKQNGISDYSHINYTDGFFEKKLCPKCNNRAGRKYNNAFIDFINQLKNSAKFVDEDGLFYLNLKDVYPLRIMKILFNMFLCLNDFEPQEIWKPIQDFVKNIKLSIEDISKFPDVYIYYNQSDFGRISPYCSVIELWGSSKVFTGSEVAWNPIGIVFSFTNNGQFEKMPNIISWGKYDFSQKRNLQLKIPKYEVLSPYPFAYGDPKFIEYDNNKKGKVYLLHVPNDLESVAPFTRLLKGRKFQV